MSLVVLVFEVPVKTRLSPLTGAVPAQLVPVLQLPSVAPLQVRVAAWVPPGEVSTNARLAVKSQDD